MFEAPPPQTLQVISAAQSLCSPGQKHTSAPLTWINTSDRSCLKSLVLEAKKAAADQAGQARRSKPLNLGEETMCRAFRLVGAAIMLGSSVLSAAEAGAIELTGAWATHADLCSQVFTKKDNRVAYAEFSELFGSGFIIDGDRIRGRAGTCQIKSRKQDGNSLELSAACASSVMTQDVRFSLKIIDDNNISRSFPEIAGMSLNYTRCKL